MAFSTLGSILNNSGNQSPLIRGVTGAMIVETANKLLQERFGTEISNHATAAYIKNDVLCIACLSTVVAQEIKIFEIEFLAEINKQIPRANLSKIRYLS